MIKPAAENGAKIAMVQNLLRSLQGRVSDSLLSSFRTTADHVSRCLQIAPEAVPVDALVDVTPALSGYLTARRYKRNSVRSYCKFAEMLLARAKQLGWTPKEPEVPDAWQSILAAVGKAGCKDIVRYAIRRRISPGDFTDRDLDAWGETMFLRGRSYGTAMFLKRTFRCRLRDAGLLQMLPRLSPPRAPLQYGVCYSSLPIQLREQLAAMLAWKQAKHAEGRPHKCRHRPVTADELRVCIQQLYGFATKIEPTLTKLDGTRGGQSVMFNSLLELVTKDRLTAWVGWLINDRRVLSGSAENSVRMLYSAVRYYPAFEGHDFGWFPKLLRQIPRDPQSGVEERKLRKYLHYDLAADIPRKIREQRREIANGDRKKMAILVRDELLIQWLMILPWRQRNIRECRLGHNLFKRELPPLGSIAIPAWVKDRVRVAPHEEFWQFDFLESETKNKERVRGVLPRQLIPLLEEYLSQHRAALLHRYDPGTLFLTGRGEPLDTATVTDLVGDLTLRYAQKRVTPHLFRDIFAYKWLQEHPTDYLTLSKHLWHKDLNTTLRCYGAKFDTSQAACEVGEWFDRREQASGYAAPAATSVLSGTVEASRPDGKAVRPSAAEQKKPSLVRDAGPHLSPTKTITRSSATLSKVIPAWTEQKATPKKALPKLLPAEIAVARAKGIQLFQRAGKPTAEQFVIVFGERGPKMTWQERAQEAGFANAEAAAVGFQAALAAKLATGCNLIS